MENTGKWLNRASFFVHSKYSKGALQYFLWQLLDTNSLVKHLRMSLRTEFVHPWSTQLLAHIYMYCTPWELCKSLVHTITYVVTWRSAFKGNLLIICQNRHLLWFHFHHGLGTTHLIQVPVLAGVRDGVRIITCNQMNKAWECGQWSNKRVYSRHTGVQFVMHTVIKAWFRYIVHNACLWVQFANAHWCDCLPSRYHSRTDFTDNN